MTTTSLEFVTLDDNEAKAVFTRHTELRADGEVIAVAVPAEFAPEVKAVLRSLADSLDHSQTAQLLIEHLTPQQPPGRGAVLQARRNSVARDALASEFGLLTSGDVAELAMSTARNAAASAARWRVAGRIFERHQRWSVDRLPGVPVRRRRSPHSGHRRHSDRPSGPVESVGTGLVVHRRQQPTRRLAPGRRPEQ